jgi:hypothetical protein
MIYLARSGISAKKYLHLLLIIPYFAECVPITSIQMKKQKIFIFMVCMAFLAIASCKRDTDCFDQQLYDQHKNDICTQDCPGVKGCDGKIYCNECIANSLGISVIH